MAQEQKIRFQGKEYLFIGNKENTHGAIAAQEQYEHGECSYAHLRDGIITRFGQQIGIRDDIEFLNTVETKISDDAIINLFTSPTWRQQTKGA